MVGYCITWDEFIRRASMNWQDIKWNLVGSYLGRKLMRFDNHILYPMRCWFNPRHDIVRRSIPQTWVDSGYLIIYTNFAIITEFVEQELKGVNGLTESIIFHSKDTESEYYNPEWLKFYQWLGRAYNYITVERPMLEKQMDAAYPSIDKDIDSWLDQIKTKESYNSKYGEVNRLEKLIEEKDTEVLVGLIHHRSGF